ncbi:Crp/Fnr family transcriptional regulator [Methylacidiphilum caldifontis]|uniref:Crp/Fnr family transcriptional regulator n=1 Tax=Methylacidiphilum caldifontis TaxID=2795386 RepID=UPI001A8C7C67|nr:Crp/Fnr family transcriptional regulator [Methylacidiphilum caldifontis]QSR88866.1 Crp/Fnr family transcriptional regulator [Methylacidiphilum caldifontis]
MSKEKEEFCLTARSVVIEGVLRRCRIFSGLSLEEIQKLLPCTKLIYLEKDQVLFRERQPVLGFYIMICGSIMVYRLTGEGKEQPIHIFYPPESFAEACLVADGYPADAKALLPSQVLLIAKTELQNLIRCRPEIALRIIGLMSNHLRKLVDKLDSLSWKDAEVRFIQWIFKQSPIDNPPSTFIPLLIPKKILAAELGITSETLSRILAKLTNEQLIRSEPKKIIILAKEKLLKKLEDRFEEASPFNYQ